MPTISWSSYNKYSGPLIHGSTPYIPDEPRKSYHVDRAFWLTSKVETGGKFGAVMAFDGTAMTAGLDQHIAVYPKELASEDHNAADDQGSLWKLVRQLETPGDSTSIANLYEALSDCGWYVSQDGWLRYKTTQNSHKAGDLVFGKEIRDTFTPIGGDVQTTQQKEIATKWILLFHAVFSNPKGFKTQSEFGKTHLVERTKRHNIGWAYNNMELTALTIQQLSYEHDLAMCMYQAHSVNAPAIALKLLNQSRVNNSLDPKKLIKLLGTSTYGRWDDDLPNGRYQRTRLAAKNSGLWPSSLFDGISAIMPRDLPG